MRVRGPRSRSLDIQLNADSHSCPACGLAKLGREEEL